MRCCTAVAAFLSVVCLANHVPTVAAQPSQSSSSSGGLQDASLRGDASASSSAASPLMVLPAGQLGNQLLSSTGIDPVSPVEIYNNYADAQQQLSLLRPDVQPGKTVFVSVLVAPKLQTNANDQVDAGFSTFDLDDQDALGPRTQLYYNCTSVAHITNLLQDANVDSLASFNITNASTEANDAGRLGLFTSATNVSASAAIQIRECTQLGNYSVGQIIYRNAFFPAEPQDAAATKWPFRVVSSDVISHQDYCVVRLEMVQASLSDLYPDCRIKFSSTDLSSLAQAASENATAQDPTRHDASRRRLGASSFEFFRNPLCYYECGLFEDEADECRTSSYEKLACRVQFYEADSDCDNECGDNNLQPSQCLSRSHSYGTIFSCNAGYAAASMLTCRQIISCRAISESAASPTKSLSWNLDTYGRIMDPERVMYEDGDCTDPTDPRSDCCRITCENCFVDLDVAALHADVDLDMSVDAHAKVVGNASITFAIYAPNGCFFTTGDIVIKPESSFSIPWYGLDIELSAALSHRLDFSLKPRGSLARYGWFTTVQARAGMLNDESFRDIIIDTTANRGIGSSAIDVSGESTWMTQVGVNLVFNYFAAVGTTVYWETYGRLDASISFPDPFPSRGAVAYNPNSWLKYGNCSCPHFMAFEATAGFRKGSADLVLSLPLKGDTTLTTIDFPSVATSVFSGCVATAYEAQLLLVTAMNAVTQLDDAKRQRLKKMLAWALGFPDIDTSSIQISSASDVDGSIVISLAVPPSISESYPQVSDLQTQMYANARSSRFVDLMTSTVGFQVASVCDDGWWGPTCSDRCYASTCRSVLCNAVDGEVLSCGACQTGFWGPKCESSCASDGDHQCASGAIVCAQGSGSFKSCDECVRGYAGDGCMDECAASQTCISPSCEQRDRYTITTCEACTEGFWGSACDSSCPTDSVHHCTDGATTCMQSSGQFNSCSACRNGFWGSACDSSCPTDSVHHCTDGATTCMQSSGQFDSCSACRNGFWGSACTQACAADSVHHCVDDSTSCAQSSGMFSSCSACLSGYWRNDCTEACPSSANCILPSCTRFGGDVESCASCKRGYWGPRCDKTCTGDGVHRCASSSAASCNKDSGDILSCSACSNGYWGADCASKCELPAHCVEGACAQSAGASATCSVCEAGYQGDQCATKASTKSASSASEVSMAALALQLVLAAAVAAVALSLR